MRARGPVTGRFERALGKSAAKASPAQIAAVRCVMQANLVLGQGAPVFIKTNNAVAAFPGGRELEMTGPKDTLRRLLERVDGLARFLVQDGPVLKDGNSFGVSQTECITVALRVSERFPGLPVIAATLPNIQE